MVLHNHLDSGVLDGDFTALLGWLYYHDVLVRFSLRHWRQGPMEDIYAEDLGADRWLTKSCKKQFRVCHHQSRTQLAISSTNTSGTA